MANASVQVQPDSTGKKVQTFENVVGGATVEAQAVVQVDPNTGSPITPGTVAVSALPGSPAQEHITAAVPHAVELSDGGAFYTATKTGQLPTALVSGRLDVNLGADGVGLATQATLAGIKTGTDKIPASPATDRTTAGAPASVELSDGAAFYTAAKTGQLPAALDGSGFLKVHEQGTATVAGTVTANIGTSGSLALEAGGNLATIVTRTPALGSSTMSGASPVTIASDQTALPTLAQAIVTAGTASVALGAQAQIQVDTGGNLRTVDLAVSRQRAQVEESCLASEQAWLLSLRIRGAEERHSFVDSRGGVGQRGTIR